MAEIPILLLAAGGSQRLGSPKQLLPWGNQTLIEFQIQKLLKTGRPVVVVLGANSEKIIPLIQSMSIRIIVNKRWQNGMGSSVSCGMNEIEKHFPDADGVMISLVDQPLISFAHYEKMLNLFKKGEDQIIASRSASGWLGVPAVFGKKYFNALKNLQAGKGARDIIRNNEKFCLPVECPEIVDDIDTYESYQQILEKFNKSL